MCFMLNRSPSVVKRLPSSCFAITSAGLTVLLIFSIRSSVPLQPEALGFHVRGGAAPAWKGQPSCCCSVCPDSHASLVSQLSYRVGQPEKHSHSVPCCARTHHHSVTRLSASMTRLPCSTRKDSPGVKRLVFVHPTASANCHVVLLFLQRELPYSSWRAYSRYLPILQTCEICTHCFPDCTTGLRRSGAKYASLADTLW